MADISAIFGVLLTLGIVFPGMLTAWWLLFPAAIERARVRLSVTPWQSFWIGLLITVIIGTVITIMILVPFVPIKVLGWILLIFTLAVSGVGASGIAAQMGQRISRSSSNLSPAGAFFCGAVILELAVFFPIIGWAILFPVAVIVSVGATTFSLLRWNPKTISVQTEPAVGHIQSIPNDSLAS